MNSEPASGQNEVSSEVTAMQQALTSLTHVISHDLRAPLRAISGFTDLLQQQCAGKLDADAEHYLQRIQQSTQRLNQMLEGLTRLAQVSQAELRLVPVDISALCQLLVTELTDRYPQWSPAVHIAPGLFACADPALIRSALLELLGNAWKYSSNGHAARIEVTGAGIGNQVELCVRDNGIGFDLQFARHLFAPFQHFHAASGLDGIGMGLAITQRIISRHGGLLRVATSPQQGAAFYCTLPAGNTL